MNRLRALGVFGIGFVLAFQPCAAQEWVQPGHARAEYVQDRIACTSDAQLMLLSGDALNREVEGCLASKGWQRNLNDKGVAPYCADMPVAISCKPGATEAIYKRDRADCTDHVMATVGNRYSQPGWWGLGGLIVSAIREQENKSNLEKAQLGAMKICLEGKGWTVNFKGASQRPMEPSPGDVYQQAPSPPVAAPVAATASQPSVPTPIVQPVQLVGESKYMFAAERLAKSNGCDSPVASMNLQGSDTETFAVACANGEPLVVRCEGNTCRALK